MKKIITSDRSAEKERIKCKYALELYEDFQERLADFRYEKDEYWKYTKLNFLAKFRQAPITSLGFADANELAAPRAEERAKLIKLLAPLVDSSKQNILVFFNGIILDEQPFMPLEKLSLSHEAASFSENGKKSEVNFPYSLRGMKKQNFKETNILALLNAALASLDCKKGEVFIKLDEAACLKKALHLVFVDSHRAQNKVISPRVHVTLEKKSKLTLLETHVENHALLTNSFVSFKLGEETELQHLYADFSGAENSIHFTRSLLGKGSVLKSYSLQKNTNKSHASSVQHESFLREKEAKLVLQGFYYGQGEEKKDFIIKLHHESPKTYSQQLFKGIVRDEAMASFTGSVKVYRDAQKTNSSQLSKTLLLGDSAKMNIRPQLEILADDVKCDHGATIGQLDADELFYLQSRGLSKNHAEEVLFLAFIEEFINELKLIFPGETVLKNLKLRD